MTASSTDASGYNLARPYSHTGNAASSCQAFSQKKFNPGTPPGRNAEIARF